MFIVVTIFMPQGIVGLPAQLRGLINKYASKKRRAEAGDAAAETIQTAKSK
jgi:hypothetical protein